MKIKMFSSGEFDIKFVVLYNNNRERNEDKQKNNSSGNQLISHYKLNNVNSNNAEWQIYAITQI